MVTSQSIELQDILTVHIDVIMVIQRIDPTAQIQSSECVNDMGTIARDDVTNVERSFPFAIDRPTCQVTDDIVLF